MTKKCNRAYVIYWLIWICTDGSNLSQVVFLNNFFDCIMHWDPGIWQFFWSLPSVTEHSLRFYSILWSATVLEFKCICGAQLFWNLNVFFRIKSFQCSGRAFFVTDRSLLSQISPFCHRMLPMVLLYKCCGVQLFWGLNVFLINIPCQKFSVTIH